MKQGNNGDGMEASHQKYRILIVEDDQAAAKYCSRALRMEPYACTIAESAARARALLQEGSYDLLLCDIMLPGEDGIHLLSWIRQTCPQIAVIMMTGLDSKEVSQQALDLGVHGYLIKPVSANQLRISVRAALEICALEKQQEQHLQTLEQQVNERTAELEKSNETLTVFKAFAENASQGLGIGTPSGQIVYVNPALARLVGVSDREDLIGNNLVAYYPDDLQPMMKQTVLPTTLSRGRWKGELRLRSENGRQVPTFESYFIIRDDDGSALYVADVVTDITELKEMHQAVRESRESFKAIVEKSNEAILVTDEEGNIRFCNTMAEQIFGRTAAQLLGSPFGLPLVEGESAEIQIIRQDSRRGMGEMRISSTRWDETPALLISIRDITERHRMEAKLKEVVRLLKTANRKMIRQQKAVIEEERLKVLLQMAGATAHELNQPLSILLGNIQLMEMFRDNSEKRDKCIGKILEAGNRISGIVQKIQTIRSPETITYANGKAEIINLEQKLRMLCVDPSTEAAGRLDAILQEMAPVGVTHVTSLTAAVESLAANAYDLILSEYRFDDGTVLELLAKKAKAGIATPVVVITGHGSEIAAAESLQAGAYGYLPKEQLNRKSLDPIIAGSLEKFRLQREMQQAMKKIAEMSTRDELTGLHNRRHFSEVLEREIARADRYGSALVVAIVDLDHFKRINDTYGHGAGDRVLKEVGRLLRESMRKIDRPCRYGGEEFAIVMPNTSLPKAAQAIERFRKNLGQTGFHHKGQPFHCTASAGIAAFGQGGEQDAATLVDRADQALYKAKQLGRNQVVIWQPPTGDSEGGKRPQVQPHLPRQRICHD
jgi:two-component system cell cycle response regulator